MAYSASAPTLPFLPTLLCFLALTAAARKAEGARYEFMKEATQAGNETEYYDYVVVGGGTAGCALAATLAEGAGAGATAEATAEAEAASPRRVLLLERGSSPYENPNVTRAENFHINLMDMSPGSPSQLFVSEDGVVNSRARVLGGGSAINAGFYSRASAGYVRAARWDGAAVKAAFEWVEARVAHRPQVRPWQAAVRDALLEVGVGPYNGFTYAHVPGTKLGGTIFDRDGFRHSAADLLSSARPDRLTVLLHATALGILFRTPRPGEKKPTAVGVRYRDAEGGIHEALLKKGGEVILSAGALGSPQLLMMSGIGPKEHLQSLGIPVLLDQPHVGIDMADNPMNSFVIPTQRPMQKSLLQIVGITKFGSYIEASSGFGTMPTSIHTAYVYEVRRGNEKKVVKPYAIEEFKGGYIVEKIKGPLSKGHLRLKSSRVDDTPAVTFNYFKNSQDLKRCVKGIREIERMVKSKSFSRFLYGERGSPSSAATARLSIAELKNMSAAMATNLRPKHANVTTSRKQFCKDTVTSIWHYHGGCVRGKVVDRDYTVMGVNSLRVVDGSTFSSSPGTNPQATVMMLGRYVGLTILKHRATTLQPPQPRPKRH